MRPVLLALVSSVLIAALSGCAPVPDADAPEEEELPCRSDADCEIAGRDVGPRTAMCTNRGMSLSSAKDIAACGPLPSMAPSSREPVMACFRGSCVPIKSQ
ncbi:MAG: hypothetical protein R3B70_10185 [Polyangiaceae bacterium]